MWFVTVLEKMEVWELDSDLVGHPPCADVGESVTWGFFSNKEDAVRVVKENVTDIHELQYDYAVIEEYEEGILNDTGKRQFYKWNKETEQYVEIEEPECVRYTCCFAIG